jgi:N-acetylmuramoyl-L-alanine amidase
MERGESLKSDAFSMAPLRVPIAALLFAFSWLLAGPVDARVIEGVRLHDAPEYTRVVFDTSGPVDYHVFTLTNPHRIVIDLTATRPRPGFDLNGVPVNGTAIRGIRGAPRDGGNYRVVLDVDRALSPNGFVLAPVAPHGHRLVIDLHGAGRSAARSTATVPRGENREIVVAIDAGHGGEDPGAIGVGGVYEKHVVLAIAREVKRLLDAERGFRGELVRTGDYYVPLRQRTQIARDRMRADLFVSIHADAFHNQRARGASVYTLSDRGATSEAARWLAERENRSDLIGGVGNVTLTDKDDLLAHVLLDLSMDASRSASIEAAEAVLRRLGNSTQIHQRRIEQAGFAVLKSPDVPSILVETGYLSNPDEARLLAQPDHQRRIARAIYEGIVDYLAAHPPPDTLVAARNQEEGRRYIIQRGDTLSHIAQRHNVSTRRLREANRLSSDTIRVGQVLVIPST